MSEHSLGAHASLFLVKADEASFGLSACESGLIHLMLHDWKNQGQNNL
jgi:hypothetical protein